MLSTEISKPGEGIGLIPRIKPDSLILAQSTPFQIIFSNN